MLRRKFRHGDTQAVVENLSRERAHSRGGPAGQAVYGLGLKLDTPGTGYICFMQPSATSQPHYEYFSLSPHGVYFRGKVRAVSGDKFGCIVASSWCMLAVWTVTACC